MYKVMVQAAPEYRAVPEQLLQLRVRTDAGELVPLSAFTTLHKTYGVDQTTRYNMYPSAELNGDGVPGVSSGTVLAAVQEVARQKLPQGFAIDWAGISRDEANAGNQGLIVGLVALLFVYLVLAGQYESFLLPAGVILSLPPGFFGALLLLHRTGLENDIFTHIALVVLIGLLGKNATLIIEFAEQRCRAGKAPLEAVLHAAHLRLRPILMTSFAFTAGLIPLAIATGAGAVANRTIGTATIGGMVMGTLWGVLLVPGLYLALKRLHRRRAPRATPQPRPALQEAVN
jgi:HAE1 family hydrophobic/amphiphilic exporter-1